jgi:transposase
MQHRNAPLTPTGRLRMVELVEEEGLTFEAAAAASNVAKSTVHLWVTRCSTASLAFCSLACPRASGSATSARGHTRSGFREQRH